MHNSFRGSGRHYWVALRAMLVLTAALGIVYPLAITGIAQVTMPNQANGSLVSSHGKIVGSTLIGQSFSTPQGNALARWFQPRPSVAGYDARSSGGSNLSTTNPALASAIAYRAAAIEKLDGVRRGSIPADALTASGSGLDPQISPSYALLQVHRVAAKRGLSEERVRRMVENSIQGRDLGFLGEPAVNVLELNIALSDLDPAGN